MQKRFIAMLLAISLFATFLPGSVFAADAGDVTITVVDENGTNITDSALSVKVTHVYGPFANRTQNVTVTNSGNGVFKFNSSTYNRLDTQYYTISVTLTKDGETYSATQQISKNVNSTETGTL